MALKELALLCVLLGTVWGLDALVLAPHGVQKFMWTGQATLLTNVSDFAVSRVKHDFAPDLASLADPASLPSHCVEGVVFELALTISTASNPPTSGLCFFISASGAGDLSDARIQGKLRPSETAPHVWRGTALVPHSANMTATRDAPSLQVAFKTDFATLRLYVEAVEIEQECAEKYCGIEHCEECDQRERCGRCAHGFYLVSTKTAASRVTITSCQLSCPAGTVLDASERRCVATGTEGSTNITAFSYADQYNLNRARRARSCTQGSTTPRTLVLTKTDVFFFETNPSGTSYDNNMACSWQFTAPTSYAVALRPFRFQTESCCDKLFLYGSGNALFATLQNTVPSGVVYTSTTSMRAYWYSDYSQVRIGVAANAYWHCASGTTLTLNANNAYFGSNAYAVSNVAYANSVTCTWVLTPTSWGYRASVVFDPEFYTELTNDPVDIFSGVGTGGALLQRYSGSISSPTAVVSTSASLTVRFMSNAATTFFGFRAKHVYAAVPCGTVALPNNQVASLSGTLTASVGTTCQNGYSFSGLSGGSTTQTFSCNGVAVGASDWSPSPASTFCRAVPCTTASVSNGSPTSLSGSTTNAVSVTCSNGYAINSNPASTTITYTCRGLTPGLSGWDPSPTATATSCQAVACPTTNTPNSGTASITGSTTTQRAITCSNGFAINGNPATTTITYTCGGTAPGLSAWTPSPAAAASSCQPVACPMASTPNSGTASISGSTGAQRAITCSNGFAINGVPSSTTITYTCGGTTPGVSAWTPDPAAAASSCQPVACPTANTPNSGAASISGSTGATRAITCSNGFAINGNPASTTITYTCGGTAPGVSAWTPDPAATVSSCRPVACTGASISNAVAGALSGSTGTQITVTCANGFSIGGGSSTVSSQTYSCSGTAPGASAWTPNPATTNCQAVNCLTTALQLTNGTSTLTGTTGATVATVCAHGYSIDGGASSTGSQTYTCTASGPAASGWQPSPASKFCQATNCASTALPFTTDVATLMGNTTVARTATCASGYAIGGGTSTVTAQTYTCTGTAAGASAWLPSPAATRCQAVACAPAALPFTVATPTLTGTTTAVVVTTCAAGYSLTGAVGGANTQSYTCTAAGPAASGWQPDPATTRCRAVSCPTTAMANTAGTAALAGLTGGAVTITCAAGYAIGGGTSTQSSQTYSCAGTTGAASAWTPNPATTFCQAVRCPLVALSNTVDTPTLLGNTTQTVAVTCADGYAIGGGSSVTTTQTYSCDATGPAASDWTPSPAATFCQGVTCAAVTFGAGVRSGASLTGTTTAAVTTQCESGFSIGGGASVVAAQTFRCTATGPAASAWLPDPQLAANTCRVVDCAPFSFAAGSTVAGGTLAGTTFANVTTTCAAGFAIGGGNSAVTAQVYSCSPTNPAQSAWTPSPAAAASSCRPVNCAPFTFAAGTTVSGSSLVGVTGAALDTVCADGYAIGGGSSLTTSARYTCTATGQAASAWLPAPGSAANSCQVVRCPTHTFQVGVGSGAELAGTTLDTVTATCADGYSVGGGSSTTTTQTYTCSASGPARSDWTPSPAAAQSSCQPKACPAVTFATATVASGGTLTGVTLDTRTTVCANGYSIGGLGSTVPSQVYTCSGTQPGESDWRPSTASAASTCQAVSCPAHTFAAVTVSAGGTLTGVTLNVRAVSCATGFAINGSLGGQGQQQYTCTAAGPAQSAWLPPPAAVRCQAVCGDGMKVAGEQCDDGNRDGGDGCSPTCQLEPGWICPVPNTPCIQCGIVTAARNQSSTCESAADALADWLAERGGAVTSTTPSCLPIVWSAPELLGTSGPSASCRTWTYLFNASFAPGGSATNEAQFRSTDTTAPTLAGVPADTTAQCSAIPSAAAVTATDSCDAGPAVVLAASRVAVPGSCADNYTLVRRWTATDACGNAATATQAIWVQDTAAPTLSNVLGNTSIACDLVGTVNTSVVRAADACDPAPPIAFSETRTEGRCAEEYTLDQQWVATDRCGNSARTFRSLRVVDNVAPVISGVPADATVECSAIPALATDVSAADACSASPQLAAAQQRVNGSCPERYTLLRTWTATDTCGNEAQRTQTISVQDTAAPTLVGPLAAELTVECDALPGTGLNVSDACDAAPGVTLATRRTEGRCMSVYTLVRNWTAVDSCGNAAWFAQTLSVQDTVAPAVVGVPGRATAECSAVPAAAAVTGRDACSSIESVVLEETRMQQQQQQQGPGSGCAHNYTLNRTWTVTDACGNSQSGSQLVDVWDTTPPALSVEPQNATVECDGAGNTAQLQAWLDSNGGAQAADACSGAAVTWSNDFGGAGSFVGGCGMTGYYEVVFTVTDACGLQAARTARFTIRDTTAPNITQLPQSQTVACDGAGNARQLEDWLADHGGLRASEGCSWVNYSHSTVPTPAFGGCGATGTQEVTFTATDGCGNAASAAARFTVTDTRAPAITAPAVDTTVQCDGSGNAGDLQQFLSGRGQAAASDACGAVSWTNNYQTLHRVCGNSRSATVTFTAADPCGNTNASAAVFFVTDTVAPVLALRGPDPQVAEGGMAWVDPGIIATDQCNGVLPAIRLRVVTAPSLLSNNTELGSFTVRYFQSDPCLNVANITRTVIVQDSLPPVFASATRPGSAPGRLLTLRLADGSSSRMQPASPTAYDLVDGDVSRFVEPMFNFSEVLGALNSTTAPPVPLAYTVSDRSGNVANQTAYLLKMLPAVGANASKESLSWSAQFASTGVSGATEQPRQPRAVITVIFASQITNASALIAINAAFTPSSGLRLVSLACSDQTRLLNGLTTCSAEFAAQAGMVELISVLIVSLEANPNVLSVTGPVSQTGIQGLTSVSPGLTAVEVQALLTQTGATVQSSRYMNNSGDVLFAAVDGPTSLNAWTGSAFAEAPVYSSQLLYKYRICSAVEAGNVSTCSESADLTHDEMFQDLNIAKFNLRDPSDIWCASSRCLLRSPLSPRQISETLMSHSDTPVAIDLVDGPFTAFALNITKSAGNWADGFECRKVLLVAGLASIAANVDGPVCTVAFTFISTQQSVTLASLADVSSISTVTDLTSSELGSFLERDDTQGSPASNLASWVQLVVPISSQSLGNISNRLSQIGLTPLSLTQSASSFKATFASLTTVQRSHILASFPGSSIQARTQSDELRDAMVSIITQQTTVDENRLRFRFEGLTRRTSAGSSAITVTIVVSPPPTLSAQYVLSCTPPSGSTCASAQSALQALGVSSDRCSFANSMLRAVVWGNETALQSSLPSLCQDTPLLAALGAQLTAAELVTVLQQLESSGALNVAVNGVIFAPVNSSSSVAILASPPPVGTSTDSSSGGSALGAPVFAGAGAGGALLVLIVVAIVLVSRRKARVASADKDGSALRRDSRLSGRAVVNPMFFETDFGPSSSAKVQQNPLFEGDETFYHDSALANFPGFPTSVHSNDGGYLDMCPTDPSKEPHNESALITVSSDAVLAETELSAPSTAVYAEASEDAMVSYGTSIAAYAHATEDPVYGGGPLGAVQTQPASAIRPDAALYGTSHTSADQPLYEEASQGAQPSAANQEPLYGDSATPVHPALQTPPEYEYQVTEEDTYAPE